MSPSNKRNIRPLTIVLIRIAYLTFARILPADAGNMTQVTVGIISVWSVRLGGRPNADDSVGTSIKFGDVDRVPEGAAGQVGPVVRDYCRPVGQHVRNTAAGEPR